MSKLVFYLSGGFLSYLRNGLAAVAFFAAILCFRAVTKRLPKIYVHILWVFFLVQLLVPPVFSSPVSWLPDWRTMAEGWQVTLENRSQRQTVPSEAAEPGESMTAPAGAEALGAVPPMGTSGAAVDTTPQNAASHFVPQERQEMPGNAELQGSGQHGSGWQGNMQDIPRVPAVLAVCACVWLAGACVTGISFSVSWLRWRKSLCTAARVERNVYETESNFLPFVLPGFPPRIYLPTGLEEGRRKDILAHEKMHIRHGDYLLKVLTVLALMLHWYNPLVWRSMRLRDKDMEMFCDEGVLRGKSLAEKKHYSETLLAFSVQANGVKPVLSFGESNTESRIRHILYSRKPGVAVSGVLVLVIAGLSVVFLTTREAAPRGEQGTEGTVQEGGAGDALPPDGGGAGDSPDLAGKDEAGENDLGSAEDSQDFHISDGFHGESPDSAAEPSVLVGEEYVPEDAVQRLLDAAPDYSQNEDIHSADYDFSRDWRSRPQWNDRMSEEEAKEIEEQILLIGRSDSFRLYGDGAESYMILGTPDGKYVWIDMAYTSNYNIQPRIYEGDFDEDGEAELAIQLCIAHGTGVFIEYLLMADRDGEGVWRAYHLNWQWYEPELEKHYATKENSGVNEDGLGGIVLALDGREVGFAMGVSDQAASKGYTYYAGSQIRYDFDVSGEARFWMNAELGAYSKEDYSGQYFANGIRVPVYYRGEGSWELGECRYYAPDLEPCIYWDLCERLGEGTFQLMDITYDDTRLEQQPVSARAELLLDGEEAVSYADMELTCGKYGNGENDYTTWEVTKFELVR